jgi:DNA-binding CsgD family transcriptional regulator
VGAAGAEDLLGQATAALASGDVEQAVGHLVAAIELDDLGAAHHLLGGILYGDDRFDDARLRWESAFAAYRRAGDHAAAARVAADLAELHACTLGNVAAGNGWLARARRELAPLGPCVEWGYLELAFMACDRPDIHDLLRSAERALALAAEFADVDLEVRALADSGLALVTQGRVREGFGRLDAALAAITAGEVHDIGVIGKSFCSMVASCDRAGDVGRAEEWIDLVHTAVLDRNGGRPRVLHTHCRAAYGSVLSRAGRWPEAEAALLEVLGPTGSPSVGHQVDTTANLAALRVDQGRIAEAAALVAPFEDSVAACLPLARIHLARGDVDLAVAVLRRGVSELVGDVLRGGALLALLVEAELRRGDVAAAEAAATEFEVRAGGAESRTLAAEAAIARGRVAVATGEAGPAARAYESALQELRDESRPLLTATARLELAEVLADAGQEAKAAVEARAALATFERLGARAARDRARALLRGLGIGTGPGPRPDATSSASLTTREAEVLELVREGLGNGEIAARLFISPKTAEHHVGRILQKLGVRTRAEAAAIATAAAFAPAADPGRE